MLSGATSAGLAQLTAVHAQVSTGRDCYTNCWKRAQAQHTKGVCLLLPLSGSCRDEDSEVLDSDTRGDAWATYYADDANSGTGGGGEPVYSPELGLAIEAPRDGATLQQLWSIL